MRFGNRGARNDHSHRVEAFDENQRGSRGRTRNIVIALLHDGE
jgi:hypothetical protein